MRRMLRLWLRRRPPRNPNECANRVRPKRSVRLKRPRQRKPQPLQLRLKRRLWQKRRRQRLRLKNLQPNPSACANRQQKRWCPSRRPRRKRQRQKLLNCLLSPKRSRRLLRRQIRRHWSPNLSQRNWPRPKNAVGGHAAKDLTTTKGLRNCGALLRSKGEIQAYSPLFLMKNSSSAPSLSCDISLCPASAQKCGTSTMAAGSSARISKTAPSAIAIKRLRALSTGKGHNSPMASNSSSQVIAAPYCRSLYS